MNAFQFKVFGVNLFDGFFLWCSGWTATVCFAKCAFILKDWEQYEQWYGLNCWWTISTCFLRPSLNPNVASQVEHLKGLTFSWTLRICNRRHRKKKEICDRQNLNYSIHCATPHRFWDGLDEWVGDVSPYVFGKISSSWKSRRTNLTSKLCGRGVYSFSVYRKSILRRKLTSTSISATSANLILWWLRWIGGSWHWRIIEKVPNFNSVVLRHCSVLQEHQVVRSSTSDCWRATGRRIFHFSDLHFHLNSQILPFRFATVCCLLCFKERSDYASSGSREKPSLLISGICFFLISYAKRWKCLESSTNQRYKSYGNGHVRNFLKLCLEVWWLRLTIIASDFLILEDCDVTSWIIVPIVCDLTDGPDYEYCRTQSAPMA